MIKKLSIVVVCLAWFGLVGCGSSNAGEVADLESSSEELTSVQLQIVKDKCAAATTYGECFGANSWVEYNYYANYVGCCQEKDNEPCKAWKCKKPLGCIYTNTALCNSDVTPID